MAAAIAIPYARDDYTVGWVCALPTELTAAIYMLKERHPDLKLPRGDSNAYILGKMGEHNVVIAGLPKGRTGTTSSATVAAQMISSFPNIKVGLMVGIGSGIPQKVWLGDVVISAPVDDRPGVIQWDMGRAEDKGFVQTGSLNPPAKLLLSSLAKFEAEQIKVHASMMESLAKQVPEYYFKSPQPKDIAYESTYQHVSGNDCSQCDDNMALKREPRKRHGLHYGLVASGNQVIKSAEQRDKLYRQFDEKILCIETEAAGLMNDFPCIVIRGISDYGDSHTNVAWQEYAAAAAAACAKTFLDVVPVSEVDKLEAVKSLIPPGMIERTVNSWFSYWFSKPSQDASPGSTMADSGPQRSTGLPRETAGPSKTNNESVSVHDPRREHPKALNSTTQSSLKSTPTQTSPPMDASSHSNPTTPPPQYKESSDTSDGAIDWAKQDYFTHNPTLSPRHTKGKETLRITRHRPDILAAAKVTHRQALGQMAAIGSLYDARKDQILTQSVFLEPLSTDAIFRDIVPSKEYRIENSGSLMATFEQLGLSPELGLSYLTGTGPYTTKGTAAHLANKRTSDAGQEVSVVCKEVTMHDTIDIGTEEMQEIVDDEALQAEEATHIVAGIWWGTRTAITAFASPLGAIANVKEKEAQLGSQERVVGYLGQLLDGSVTTAFSAFKEISKSLTFRVEADIDPNKQSAQISDFDGVCGFIGRIPDAIKGTKTGNGVRIMYDLVPIKDFAQIINRELEGEVQLVQPIDQEYQNRVLFLFEKLYAARVSLNSYLRELSRHELSVPKQHVETIKTNISRLDDLEDRLKSELYQDLLRARDFSFKGTYKLNNPEWEADIEEFESLVSKYAAKMTFESGIAALGIRYMHPADTTAAYSKHQSGTYTLFYSDAALVAPSWKDQYAQFMELAYAKNSEHLLYVVDCDFEAGQELRVPRIELRENGEVVTNDFLAEQRSFAGKCFVRAATPADMEELPAKLLDSIRRSVTIRCPCAAAIKGDCFCRTCKSAIFLLEDDDYMYCNCGRYRPTSAAFKCLEPAHGTSYLTYKDSETLLEAYEYQEFEQHNILLLGEMGVGKSTFINAFMNYMQFETLDEALEAPDLHWAIPSVFKYIETKNKKFETFTVTVGEETKAQKCSLDGELATQSCVTYVLHMNGLTLRLIDTPGIGDTRGLQQDKENVNDILQALKSVEKISTILFLIKPDISRLGQMFNFCMTELLSHLHKETNQNIVFGFTNCRSTNYSLGDAGIILQKFLKDKKIDIAVDYDNTFFFDSEGFRYLAAYKTINKEMEDKDNCEKSFQHSAGQARRLVNKTVQMRTHEVRKTLSLSDTRLYIEGLKNLTILINRMVNEDQEEIEKHKIHIKELEIANGDLEDKLKMTIQKPVKKMLPSPRTVCTDSECRTVNRDTDGKEHVVYKQICHDYCYIKATNELVGAPEISTCEVFDYSAKPCIECGHEWDKHQHISYTLTVEEVEVDDPVVLETYNSNKSKLEKAEAAIESLLQKMEMLGERRDFINFSLASFAAYLSSAAMVRCNDAAITYLDYLIDNAKKEGSDDSQRQFEEQRRIYKEQYDETTQGNPKPDLLPKVPNYDEIMEIIQQLDQIEVNGSTVKDLVQGKMDNTLSPCNTVTLPLEITRKGVDSFSWIKRLPPRSPSVNSYALGRK
ncbi:uncharacterized protein TrAtP1_004422 [Trichoderma atroviride]|uniref:uncharacterized protein n=1 Tax=Hypocrea atroviridis TaxID=63577 RepID=UPI0033179A88|nr:hypothetical protein TrAtP1_004422 [Trichoderma atroviride]